MNKKVAGAILGFASVQYGIFGVAKLSVWMVIVGIILGLVGLFLWTYDEL